MSGIRLPLEIETRLSALAKRTGRTKTYYAREAIITYLNDLEDYYLIESTKNEKTCSFDEVVKELGFESEMENRLQRIGKAGIATN